MLLTEALHSLLAGRKITRKDWNDDEDIYFVYLDDEYIIRDSDGTAADIDQVDTVATDWTVVPETHIKPSTDLNIEQFYPDDEDSEPADTRLTGLRANLPEKDDRTLLLDHLEESFIDDAQQSARHLDELFTLFRTLLDNGVH